MGTALVIGITVTLRLTVFGVEAFVLGKPPPTGPAEKGCGVSHLRTITRKRRYEQADGVQRAFEMPIHRQGERDEIGPEEQAHDAAAESDAVAVLLQDGDRGGGPNSQRGNGGTGVRGSVERLHGYPERHADPDRRRKSCLE